MASKVKKQVEQENILSIKKETFTLFPYGYQINTANKDIILLQFYESHQVNKKKQIQIQGTFALNRDMAKALAEEILKDFKKV